MVAETLELDESEHLLHALLAPRPGRITDIIDCNFPRERSLEIRETPEFIAIAQRVRNGLRAGHSYDE